MTLRPLCRLNPIHDFSMETFTTIRKLATRWCKLQPAVICVGLLAPHTTYRQYSGAFPRFHTFSCVLPGARTTHVFAWHGCVHGFAPFGGKQTTHRDVPTRTRGSTGLVGCHCARIYQETCIRNTLELAPVCTHMRVTSAGGTLSST